MEGAVATSVAEHAPKGAAITDEDALPETLKNEAEPYGGSPI